MREMAQKQAVRVGVVGMVMTASVVLASLQYQDLQFVKNGVSYSAVFNDASGVAAGDEVNAAGVKIGTVDNIAVEKGRARVDFTLDGSVTLGESTSAAITTMSLLGKRALSLDLDGSGRIPVGGQIPLERTRSAYSLPDVLGDLTTTVEDINLDQLSASLEEVGAVMTDSAPSLRPALDGVARLSDSINRRDETLKLLLADANNVAGLLADRGPQVNALLVDGDALLGELVRRQDALGNVITDISAVSTQLSGLVHDNEAQLGPVLNKLDTVLGILQKNKDNLAQGIDGLGTYVGTLGDTVASGPFYYSYIQNLLPAQYTQPLINAIVGLPPAPLPIPEVR
ncbi:UNVERIFIED_ORG: phospholipid/cholesterol/gamma-HCH transport system substrate-binding protein [Nocardia globerula]|uniref:Phospholipid/cholesterol/gamma-HCH transport system substrate-binding protein n=3 Tax=Nocardiaceae TaxID=85025 RepID=A0A652YYZ8_NOCGL|nr:virulence factor Mce family protein [Rhodococcus sp. AD45]PVX65218.1 phospholipid/cholesterol/gamma-HCH transport system substrate-binding protein [Rhodococcus globerulus]